MRLMWQRYGREFYCSNPSAFPKGMPDLILEATGIDVSEPISRYAEGRGSALGRAVCLHGITLKAKDTQKEPSLDVRFKQSQGELHLATVTSTAQPMLQAYPRERFSGCRWSACADTSAARAAVGDVSRRQTVPVHVFRRDELRSHSVTLTPSIQKQFEFTIAMSQTKTALITGAAKRLVEMALTLAAEG